MDSIIDAVTGDGRFNSLAIAVKAAFLAGTLMDPGPFTLFAPTDDAFALVPPNGFRPLFEDRGRLAALVARHIVPARMTAADMLAGGHTRTLHGEMLRINAHDGDITVNGAHVLQTDMECANGVIHAIDAVLRPAAEMAA